MTERVLYLGGCTDYPNLHTLFPVGRESWISSLVHQDIFVYLCFCFLSTDLLFHAVVSAVVFGRVPALSLSSVRSLGDAHPCSEWNTIIMEQTDTDITA